MSDEQPNTPEKPKSEWFLTPEEASRVAKGHAQMMNLPATDPIAPAKQSKGDEEPQVIEPQTDD